MTPLHVVCGDQHQCIGNLGYKDLKLIVECQRPLNHDGDHAAIYANGFITWSPKAENAA